MNPELASHFIDQEIHEWLCNLEFQLNRHYLTFRWQSDAVLGKANLPRNGSGANSSEPGMPEPIRSDTEGRESERPVAVHRPIREQSDGHRQFAQPQP